MAAVVDKETPMARELTLREEAHFVESLGTNCSEGWYIIDANWVKQWKQFVTTGALWLYPGPITNNHLLDLSNELSSLRPALKVKHDYRAVGREAWEYLHTRYGGGPCIQCRTLDIYAPNHTRILNMWEGSRLETSVSFKNAAWQDSSLPRDGESETEDEPESRKSSKSSSMTPQSSGKRSGSKDSRSRLKNYLGGDRMSRTASKESEPRSKSSSRSLDSPVSKDSRSRLRLGGDSMSRTASKDESELRSKSSSQRLDSPMSKEDSRSRLSTPRSGVRPEPKEELDSRKSSKNSVSTTAETRGESKDTVRQSSTSTVSTGQPSKEDTRSSSKSTAASIPPVAQDMPRPRRRRSVTCKEKPTSKGNGCVSSGFAFASCMMTPRERAAKNETMAPPVKAQPCVRSKGVWFDDIFSRSWEV